MIRLTPVDRDASSLCMPNSCGSGNASWRFARSAYARTWQTVARAPCAATMAECLNNVGCVFRDAACASDVGSCRSRVVSTLRLVQTDLGAFCAPVRYVEEGALLQPHGARMSSRISALGAAWRRPCGNDRKPHQCH